MKGHPRSRSPACARLTALTSRPRRGPTASAGPVTVQVQGQEVLSEKMEPSDFQPLPQTKPRTTEPGPETPPGGTRKSPLSLRVKEEPEVTEDPGDHKSSGSEQVSVELRRMGGSVSKETRTLGDMHSAGKEIQESEPQ
ncbi:Myeloid zinc finger 1 [Pteropus alecto]|uniref:Myeloid zinc finger 1 n=1 Tax=Pteropus alecto TaxID=9402 RepID=L5L5U3_PTEAL|nr:Myeloid zinc finger 1 [Pteropus alecto]